MARTAKPVVEKVRVTIDFTLDAHAWLKKLMIRVNRKTISSLVEISLELLDEIDRLRNEGNIPGYMDKDGIFHKIIVIGLWSKKE